jgi:transcription initiation factor IIF auxiliary subunit
MSSDFEIRQDEKFEGNDWWTWAVWVEGSEDALDKVDSVEWTLHPTFSNPIRKVHNRQEKFRLVTGGWGEFQIRARVEMKDGKTVNLRHDLRLHYPDGTETSA